MAKVFNMTTNKNGLFVYAGEASSDYGMVIAEAPAFERGKRKTTVYNVPGRKTHGKTFPVRIRSG